MDEPGPSDTMTGRHDARGCDGKFIRTPETAARDAEAARLRARGMSYPSIARKLGYATHTGAVDAVSRALADITREPAEELVKLELERLDTALARAHEVMDATHYVSSSRGEVVEYEGSPLIDDGPVLAAALAIVRIGESRRKLLGLDAPQRVSVEAQGLSDEIRSLLGDLAGGSGEDEPDGDTQSG